MASAPIPSYPVIHVDVRADGSAHVNVAGRHIDYPAGPIVDTRAAVIRYAVEMARTLGRPVRMTTTDPAGTFELAAHTDGTVSDLTTEAKSKRRRRTPLEQNPATVTAIEPGTPRQATPLPASIVAPVPSPVATAAASVDDDVEATRLTPRRLPSPAATLTFSSGEAVSLRSSALVGRRPVPYDDESVDQLVPIDDATRTVSKTHFRVEWHEGGFWIADRSSANGTIVQREGTACANLTAWEPYELHHGDVVLAGDVTFTVCLDPSPRAQDRS